MTFYLSRRGVLGAALAAPTVARASAPVTLLNASYDPTREFYKDFNGLFAAEWRRTMTGGQIKVFGSRTMAPESRRAP